MLKLFIFSLLQFAVWWSLFRLLGRDIQSFSNFILDLSHGGQCYIFCIPCSSLAFFYYASAIISEQLLKHEKRWWLSANSECKFRRCFLSDETRSVASIIESILQCALDFRSCLSSSTWDVGLDQGDLLGKLSRINVSQVILISYANRFPMQIKHWILYL